MLKSSYVVHDLSKPFLSMSSKKESDDDISNTELNNLKQTTNGNAKSARQNSSPSTKNSEKLGFRYIWPVKVSIRQLGRNETMILQISPKFATVHDHVSFQFTLKMHGTLKSENRRTNNDDDDDDEDDAVNQEEECVAISLYYVDGPVSTMEVRANVQIVGDKNEQFVEDKTAVLMTRGRESELASANHREYLSKYIKEHVGHVIRLSLLLEMSSSLFRTDTYLNAVSPTPIHSFLTANYRARASSKVWKRRSRQSVKRPRSASDGQSNCCTKKLDLEKAFNRVMERERERRALCEDLSGGGSAYGAAGRRRSSLSSTISSALSNISIDNPSIKIDEESPTPPQSIHSDAIFTPTALHVIKSVPAAMSCVRQPPDQHLFKKLLVACCDSCERRASLIIPAPSSPSDDEPEEEEDGEEADETISDDEDETTSDGGGGVEEEEEDDDEDANTFECPEENKADMHDTLANMYFNKVALPEMEYVEDFADFLIDAELNDLPVLKRACERYLCGELNTKKDLMTSLLLELLFLSMVFHLPVMKSMTLTELCDRHAELKNVDKLLEQEEYMDLDKRIRQLCDRNLSDLIDECKRFREQRNRVHEVQVDK